MERWGYALAYSRFRLVTLTLVSVAAVGVMAGANVLGQLWVAVVAAYLVLVTLALRQPFRVERAARLQALEYGWGYAVRGPAWSHYGSTAAPTGATQRSATALRSWGTHRGRVAERMFVSSELSVQGANTYVELIHLNRNYPSVRLIPRAWFRREVTATRAVTLDWQDFSHNSRWRVEASDAEFARALFNVRTLARLMNDPEAPRTIVISGPVAFVAGHKGPARDDRHLELLVEIMDALPSSAVARFGHEHHDWATQGRRRGGVDRPSLLYGGVGEAAAPINSRTARDVIRFTLLWFLFPGWGWIARVRHLVAERGPRGAIRVLVLAAIVPFGIPTAVAIVLLGTGTWQPSEAPEEPPAAPTERAPRPQPTLPEPPPVLEPLPEFPEPPSAPEWHQDLPEPPPGYEVDANGNLVPADPAD